MALGVDIRRLLKGIAVAYCRLRLILGDVMDKHYVSKRFSGCTLHTAHLPHSLPHQPVSDLLLQDTVLMLSLCQALLMERSIVLGSAVMRSRK